MAQRGLRGMGISFSPIPTEKTMEDLPALLSRLFGGAGEGGRLGLKRMPGLGMRGVPPDEILRQFLQAGGMESARPSVSEVFGPSAPEVEETPPPAEEFPELQPEPIPEPTPTPEPVLPPPSEEGPRVEPEPAPKPAPAPTPPAPAPAEPFDPIKDTIERGGDIGEVGAVAGAYPREGGTPVEGEDTEAPPAPDLPAPPLPGDEQSDFQSPDYPGDSDYPDDGGGASAPDEGGGEPAPDGGGEMTEDD